MTSGREWTVGRRAPVDPDVERRFVKEIGRAESVLEQHAAKEAALRDRRAVLWMDADDAGVPFATVAEAAGVGLSTVKAEVKRARALGR